MLVKNYSSNMTGAIPCWGSDLQQRWVESGAIQTKYLPVKVEKGVGVILHLLFCICAFVVKSVDKKNHVKI